jgi:hypothetical protein
MDDLFSGIDRAHTVVTGMVVLSRTASLLFFEDETATEVFVPTSQIVDWWFVDNHGKKGLRLEDLKRNDQVSLVIPKWLARREGFI